jgi:hypothetical protein
VPFAAAMLPMAETMHCMHIPGRYS